MSKWIGGNDWVGKIVGTDLQEYVNEHYHRRKRAIWPFLLKKPLPFNLSNQLDNIRECFALMQFDISVISCRILIELAAFDYLKKKGDISNKVINLSEYSLAGSMKSIKEYIAKKSNYNNAWKVIKLADKILHSKSDKPFVGEDMAYYNIKLTINFIEDLFS